MEEKLIEQKFMDEKLFEVLICAAAYTIVNSNATDEDKELLLAFVDENAPGFMDQVAMKIDTRRVQQ